MKAYQRITAMAQICTNQNRYENKNCVRQKGRERESEGKQAIKEENGRARERERTSERENKRERKREQQKFKPQ